MNDAETALILLSTGFVAGLVFLIGVGKIEALAERLFKQPDGPMEVPIQMWPSPGQPIEPAISDQADMTVYNMLHYIRSEWPSTVPGDDTMLVWIGEVLRDSAVARKHNSLFGVNYVATRLTHRLMDRLVLSTGFGTTKPSTFSTALHIYAEQLAKHLVASGWPDRVMNLRVGTQRPLPTCVLTALTEEN